MREPRLGRSIARRTATVAALGAGLLPLAAHGQVTPEQATQIRDAMSNRVEALTILGGASGIAGADFRSTGRFEFSEPADAAIAVSKFGGAGDIGDPQPLGSLAVGWQPRLQGNMGWLEGTQHLNAGLLEGDVSRIKTYGIEFGGGVRFWVDDHLSFAPTLSGLYGHTSETYTANSVFMRTNLETAKQIGLVDWTLDTWTLITGVDIQYLIALRRTIITVTSSPVYYHTESFESSSASVNVKGDSGTWANMVDVDIPLGVELFGHELRMGGFYRWTGLYGGLRDGLHESNFNEIHGRLVLDFLTQLWKVQWIGIGGSYIRGPNISGWTAGADVVFRF